MATCLRCMPFQFLRMAGALTFLVLVWRPWRTSWLIVGTKTLLLLCRDGAVGPDRGDRSSRHDTPLGGPVGTGAVGSGGGWVSARDAEAYPSRGHERGVYRWAGISVKRA